MAGFALTVIIKIMLLTPGFVKNVGTSYQLFNKLIEKNVDKKASKKI